MEFALILVLLLAVLGWSVRSSGTSRKRSRHDRLPPFEGPSSRPAPNVLEDLPTAKPDKFDGLDADPVAGRLTITGTAYVVDGDTLIIQKTQVRLFGIDAPELGHPYGNNAKWTLVSLCKGQKVHAEIVAKDDHGRTVARCSLQDGRDLSAEMVKLGLAIDWPKFSGGKYSSFEMQGARKKLWLADARQKGRMHVWENYEAWKRARIAGD